MHIRLLSPLLKDIFVACFVGVFASASASYDMYSEEQNELPVVLQYQGNLISNDCIKSLLEVGHWGYDDGLKEIDLVQYYAQQEQDTLKEDALLDDDEDDWFSPKDSFRWNYLGALANDFHAICGCEDWGGRNTNVTVGIISRSGDVLRRISTVMGQDYEVRLKNGGIRYSYPVADRTFIEIVATMYPEIKPLYDRSSKKGLYYGVGSYCGTLTNTVTISSHGAIESDVISSFYCAEGWIESGKLKGDKIKKLALKILHNVDTNIPDALKEEGVAYSPHCFARLLEHTIKNDDDNSHSVQISLHKNDAYEKYDDKFTWEYIGEYVTKQGNPLYCIYAEYDPSSDGCDGYSGIYLIEKDNDFLRKVACLARESLKKNAIVTPDFDSYSTPEITLVGNTLTYYQTISAEYCVKNMIEPLCALNGNTDVKDFLIEEDTSIGTIEVAVQLSDDGVTHNKTIVGFCPYKTDMSDEIYQAVESSALLPIDQAVNYCANDFCKKHASDRYCEWHYYIKGDDLTQVLNDAVQSTRNKSVICA